MNMKSKCSRHWVNLGISNEKALQGYIEKVFEKHDHQADVLIDLYRMIFPDWEKIEKIVGYPEAGQKLWRFIHDKFVEFDHRHHPKVFPGGLWFNTGFSSNDNLDPWAIGFDNSRVILI